MIHVRHSSMQTSHKKQRLYTAVYDVYTPQLYPIARPHNISTI